jgi:SAM-dependent methyltransferase
MNTDSNQDSNRDSNQVSPRDDNSAANWLPQVWDERYRADGLVWGEAPNVFVARELADVPAGRGLDVACGEGRHAIWLAGLGWTITGVDYSPVALDKARSLATAVSTRAGRVDWVCADVTSPEFERPEPASLDLVLIAYLQVPAQLWRPLVAGLAGTLRPNGHLLLVAHDLRNLSEGVGGPSNPDVLYRPADVVAAAPELKVVTAATEPRTTDKGIALDTVVHLIRR